MCGFHDFTRWPLCESVFSPQILQNSRVHLNTVQKLFHTSLLPIALESDIFRKLITFPVYENRPQLSCNHTFNRRKSQRIHKTRALLLAKQTKNSLFYLCISFKSLDVSHDSQRLLMFSVDAVITCPVYFDVANVFVFFGTVCMQCCTDAELIYTFYRLMYSAILCLFSVHTEASSRP